MNKKWLFFALVICSIIVSFLWVVNVNEQNHETTGSYYKAVFSGWILINALWVIISILAIIRFLYIKTTNSFDTKYKRLTILCFFAYVVLTSSLYLLRISDKYYSRDYTDTFWHIISIRAFEEPEFHGLFFSLSLILFWSIIAGINWVRNSPNHKN